MPTMKLGRRELAALLKDPPTKAVTFFDEREPGFGVRFSPGGHASYVLHYRPRPGGRNTPKRLHTIGQVGDWTFENAREEARNLKADIRRAKPGEGADPMKERQDARRAATLEELIKLYLAEHVAPKRKKTTLELYRGYLRKHIAPRRDAKDPTSPLLPGAFGGKRAIDITHEAVSNFHLEIGEKRPRTANACVTLIAAAYTWGAPKKKAGLTPTSPNPTKGIERFDENERECVFDDGEWERIADTLALAETDGLPWTPDPSRRIKHAPKEENRRVMADKYAVACIRLLMLTGCRLREILNLEWAHVDFEKGVLRLPDSKTGAKIVVLSDAALEILEGLRPTNYKYVIAGETAGQSDERPRSDIKRPWARIIKHAGLGAFGVKGKEGYRPPLRIHDLRHAYASNAVESGMSLFIVGKLLGHKDQRTTQKYAHARTETLKGAANANSASIQAKTAGKRSAAT